MNNQELFNVHQALSQAVRDLWCNGNNDNLHLAPFTDCKVGKNFMVCPILEAYSISMGSNDMAYLEKASGVSQIQFYDEIVEATADREAYVVRWLEVPIKADSNSHVRVRALTGARGRNWERAATFFVLFLFACLVLYYRQMIGKLF